MPDIRGAESGDRARGGRVSIATQQVFDDERIEPTGVLDAGVGERAVEIGSGSDHRVDARPTRGNQCAVDIEEDEHAPGLVSDLEHRPENLEQQHATWIDWGPYLDGQLSYRHVYRENPIVAAIARAVLGDSVSDAVRPYVPIAQPCTQKVFESGGWKACRARGA